MQRYRPPILPKSVAQAEIRSFYVVRRNQIDELRWATNDEERIFGIFRYHPVSKRRLVAKLRSLELDFYREIAHSARTYTGQDYIDLELAKSDLLVRLNELKSYIDDRPALFGDYLSQVLSVIAKLYAAIRRFGAPGLASA